MKKIISLILASLMLLSVTAVYAAEKELSTDPSWEITVSSDISNTAGRAFDGDPSTHWHSKYTAEDGEVKSHDGCPFYITVDFGTAMKISGWKYTPRQGNGTGIVTKYNIYASTDGKTFKQIFTGTFDYLPVVDDNRPVSKASWGDVEMKAIKIEYTESVGNYGTAAEINFLTGGIGKTNGSGATLNEKNNSVSSSTDSKTDSSASASASSGKLSKKGWTATVNSEVSWGHIEKVLDDNVKTYWHSGYEEDGGAVTSHDEPPFTVEITLPEVAEAMGFMYTPRPDNQAGRWMNADVYISADGKDKGTKVGTVTSDGESADPITLDFGKKLKVKKITVIINEARGSYGSCSEIDLLSDEVKNADTSSSASSGEETYEVRYEKFINDLKKLDKSTWQITANSEISWAPVTKLLDDDLKTYWHSNYTNEGDKITSHDETPFLIEITLPKAENATGLLYYPRKDSPNGRWLKADVYVSSDGKGKGEKVGTIESAQDVDTAIVLPFGKELKVKKVTIDITESVGKYGSCRELDLISGAINFPKEDLGPELSSVEEGMYSTKGWKFKVNSNINYGAIEKAFDENVKTYWHSNYTFEGTTVTGHDNPPYIIDITLPEKKAISGFTLYNRTDSSTGRPVAYELYAADTDDGELVKVAADSISSAERSAIEFGCAFEAKKMQFIVTDSVNGYGTIAELYFKKGTETEPVFPISEFMEKMDETILKPIDNTGFKAENELPVWASCTPKCVFDNGGGFWQTEELLTTDPVILRVDLGKVYTFSAIAITPRSSADLHGFWEKFNVWVGESDADMTELYHDYSFSERTTGKKTLLLEQPVTARYVEFEITKFNAKRVSCGEIEFLQNKEQRDAVGGAGKYVMQIGSKEISITRGGKTEVKTIDVAPYITSAGRTLIPLRGLLEEMGAEITWEDKNQSITVVKDGISILLQIRNNLVKVASPALGNLVYTLESEPRIKDSRTFVPLRFLSEQFGYEVTWDGATQTITIKK